MRHVLAVDVLMEAHVRTTVKRTSPSVIYVPTVSVKNVTPTQHVVPDFVVTTLPTQVMYVRVMKELFAIP